MSDSFCPRCGSARLAGYRFCRGCGLDLDLVAAERPEVAPPRSQSVSAEGLAPLLAGIAWIICGGLTAYLALLQLGYADYVTGTDMRALAAWNGLAALTALFFGAWLFLRVRRSALVVSVLWAAINVLVGIYQVAQGATHWAFIGATVSGLAAGAISLAALSSSASGNSSPDG